MRRRDLIAASAVLPALAAGTGATAGDERPSSGAASLAISGVGLPVIAGGRIRNYVFVALRLHLGGGATAEAMRAKEAFFRDALVRAGHRTPFVLPDDWTRLDERALSAGLIRASAAIVGPGKIVRVEVVSQAPRRRTGVRAG